MPEVRADEPALEAEDADLAAKLEAEDADFAAKLEADDNDFDAALEAEDSDFDDIMYEVTCWSGDCKIVKELKWVGDKDVSVYVRNQDTICMCCKSRSSHPA